MTATPSPLPPVDDLAAALMAGAPVVALRTARGVGKSDWCIVLASRA